MKDCSDSDQVDVVIGIDSYYRFLGSQIQRNGPEDPVAVESVLGWIMCGSSALRHQSQPLSALWILWIRALTGPVGWKCDPEMSEQEKSFWDDFFFDRARYSVRLLKNDGEMELPNHFVSARRRLRAVERRLAQDSDYLKNGWAERMSNEGKSGRMWYLSHHVVYQQGPEGIVFDGSEKNQGTSLNDHLDAGPKVQTDLMGILLRFRRFRVVLQLDIAKMYLQVGLHEDERDFCRFLWRDRDCSDTLDIYRLTRVCFGLACLPCASNALPEVADEIKSCKYVDDLVPRWFSLTKWVSNAPEALSDLPAEDWSSVDRSRLWKTLGISWDPQLDQLPICLLSQATSETQGTKRGLRLAALVFDPLGALTPFTVRAKQLLQSLWQTGISWDGHLPPEISRKWDQWRADLSDLHQIVLPREYLPYSPMEASRLELHGFGDASEAAYAAVVYLRATQSMGVTRVSFVPAKSEVAPLKKLSVPRLELSAALLCVRLVRYVLQELALPVDACYCWSDSLVALGWIRGDGGSFRREPSSTILRILRAEGSLKWWQGPSWLQFPPETWQRAGRQEEIEGLEVLEDAEQLLYWLQSYRRKMPGRPRSGRRIETQLSVDELKEAERIWIRQEQIHAFGSKYPTDKSLTNTLCGLNPFLDEFGVLRVSGRLGRAQLEEEAKFPPLLPCKRMIVNLLIRREHNQQLHAGVAQTLAALRERF
ncbi:hypothetical protein T4D_4317 [Trichinella pseudospiralis]|uniref:Peptidase aspartic putative domain-containing protein n=1 Tax=Trichinella pseudospiralis TaxID=6337 RepID=A0A0V1F7V3_TRIPS|nr:hypothetical protein T4D_4317 [Trichinella pseudospiralis]